MMLHLHACVCPCFFLMLQKAISQKYHHQFDRYVIDWLVSYGNELNTWVIEWDRSMHVSSLLFRYKDFVPFLTLYVMAPW